MKPPALPILALEAFAPDPQHQPPYYVQRLETHLAQFPAVSKPHAHSFYLLLYITQGSGSHTIDAHTHALRAGSLFFLAPGQVHAWQLSADAQGYIVFFSAAFYQRQYPAARLAAYPFFDPAQRPVLYLPAAQNEIEPLFASMLAEKQQAAPNEHDVVGAYLFLALELASRAYAPPAAAPPPAHAQEQVRAFTHLLDQHFRQHKTVRFYAQQLHLTPNHLNAVCRRLLAKTASDLIHARVIAEAQRLLRHSAQTVAQVAAALGFDDTSYFSRYFRKYVGQPPEAFRQAPDNR
jgi:AraC family transcriptional activator of pobA